MPFEKAKDNFTKVQAERERERERKRGERRKKAKSLDKMSLKETKNSVYSVIGEC